ncbi:MarR family winged helix-turn-helix transcriptional regulator [Streptomyces sp. NPDC050560]|uniref:MarR family winged helix-turn-helix transcriptional regulator n=1 Tax=Streptomyces sp. NPDC050560 TaxID=3365630 RepID=UPI0037B9758F
MAREESTPASPAPGDTLGEVLLALGGRLTRLQTEILASLGQPLTIRQYRILARVDAGNTSLTALSKLARRNLSTMSESVDKLVHQGLLTRAPSETSRRTMRLALTKAGTAALEAADGALAKFTSELTTNMPRELQDQVLPALRQLYTDVQGNLDDR